jgi:hypothetical protein
MGKPVSAVTYDKRTKLIAIAVNVACHHSERNVASLNRAPALLFADNLIRPCKLDVH